MDLNKRIRKALMRTVVNQDVINLPDRDITSIVLNCYSNLHHTKLAGYTIDYADVATEFACAYDVQLAKLRAKAKNKGNKIEEDDLSTELEKLLGISKSSVSVDISDLHNNFSVLKLRYVLDPVGLIKDKFILSAVKKTLAAWDTKMRSYKNVSSDTYDYLKYLLKVYSEKDISGEVIASNDTSDKENNVDLFIDEQVILLPVYDNDAKYTINGVKYYGVFNNRDGGVVTKGEKYAFKVFNGSKIYTMYLLLIEGVMYMQHFGEWHNVCHMISDENCMVRPIEHYFPDYHDAPESYKYIYDRTYEHAKMLETKDPHLSMYLDRCIMPEDSKNGESKKHNGRAKTFDIAYRKQILASVKEYIYRLEHPELERSRTFSFLNNLEESIYTKMNANKISKPNPDITYAKKRINLSPITILHTIKSGSAENSDTLLFTSTSVEPNPFDVFYLFSYMRVTPHTETNKNSGSKSSSMLKHDEKLIKWDDPLYLGEFSPKSEKNIGVATTLRWDIPSELILKRKPIS